MLRHVLNLPHSEYWTEDWLSKNKKKTSQIETQSQYQLEKSDKKLDWSAQVDTWVVAFTRARKSLCCSLTIKTWKFTFIRIYKLAFCPDSQHIKDKQYEPTLSSSQSGYKLSSLFIQSKQNGNFITYTPTSLYVFTFETNKIIYQDSFMYWSTRALWQELVSWVHVVWATWIKRQSLSALLEHGFRWRGYQ